MTNPAHALDAPESTTSLRHEVGAELRWCFTRPWEWLRGVVVNLLLSLGYLVIVPVSGHHRGAWVVLVGTYFANFILADVTTTNVVGADAARVPDRLERGESIRRLLLVKNLTIITIVGVPTLALTAVLTIADSSRSLAVTVPAVAFPVLCWLAFGDVVSVLLAVRPQSVRARWRARRDRFATGLWALHLAVPYGLFFVIEALRHVPRSVDSALPHLLARTAIVHGVILVAIGALIWAVGLFTASAVVKRRGLDLH